jgi:hypothetical protein
MRDCPILLKSKKKMTQKQNQRPNPTTAKEVNHTSHWHQPSQSSSSNQPSYQHHNNHSEYQPNYHRYPSPYYQPHNYAPHIRQIQTTEPTITYPSTPLQITYLTASTQVIQPKTKPNNPPPPPPKNQESSHQGTNFPTFKTIHTITGGSNLSFEKKRHRREYYHQVNHVAVEGTVTRTKWLHVPITFNENDIKLVSFCYRAKPTDGRRQATREPGGPEPLSVFKLV